MAPTVDVVMLTWNQLPFTRRTIASYRTFVKAPYRLICIDNGSTDGTVEYLRAEADLLVSNSANVGAIRGRNQGWAVSDADYILSTDNDVEFATDIVERLVAVAEAHPELGIVGPLLNEHLQQAGLPSDHPLPELTELIAQSNTGRIEHARYVPGCALFRRRMIDEVGDWDTAYDTWAFEEYDYCQRAKAAGWGVALAMDCYVHHHGNTSVRQLPDKDALAKKNRALFLSRWGMQFGEGTSIIDPGSTPRPEPASPSSTDRGLAAHVLRLRRVAGDARPAAWPQGGVESFFSRLPSLGPRALVVGAAPASSVKVLRHLYSFDSRGYAPDASPLGDYGVACAEAHALPEPDASWDGVVALDCLERSALPLVALLEMRRVTRPGGLIAAVVPRPEIDALLRPGYFSVLTDPQWRVLFRSAQLEVLDERDEDAAGDRRTRYVLRRPDEPAAAAARSATDSPVEPAATAGG